MSMTKQGADGAAQTLNALSPEERSVGLQLAASMACQGAPDVRVAAAVKAYLAGVAALDQYEAAAAEVPAHRPETAFPQCVIEAARKSCAAGRLAQQQGAADSAPGLNFQADQTVPPEVLSALLALISAALADGREPSEFRAQAHAVLAAMPAFQPESSS